MPSPNHLVVSLGGTGGRVMRAFRKRLFSEFRGSDPTVNMHVLNAVNNAVFLQYLMVDTSAGLFNNHRGWRVLGTSTKPSEQNWLHLRQGIDVPSFIRSSRSFPGISQWIGDQNVWRDVASNVLTGEAGGQRRRLGRLLFAANASRFEQAITNLSQDLTRRSNLQGVTYHILCGLAGGTGSGAIVDAIAQICRLSTHPDDRVRVYAVLPERSPRPEKSQTYYHANAYAALKELNAMLVSEYKPWDVVRGNGSIDVGSKLQAVTLISNENMRNYTVPMDDDDTDEGGLSEVIGDYLFEKLVVETLSGGTASPITTAENTAMPPEHIPGTDRAVRSRAFLSFGIRRVAVPEEEIREYFTLSYARQALNHLRYNNWDEMQGFVEREVPRNFLEMASDPTSRERWRLSDAHLEYVTAVLPQDANREWRPTIEAEWDAWLLSTAETVRDTVDTRSQLTELYEQCQAEFDLGYRGTGVRKFYESRAESARQIGLAVRQHLEQDLIRSWQNGTLALADVRQLATAIRKDLAERIGNTVGSIPDLRELSEAASADIQQVMAKWARKVIPLGRGGLFDDMKQACREKFIIDTRLAAAEYLKIVGPRIVEEITLLETSVQSVESQFVEALKEVKAGLDARLKPRLAQNTEDHIFRMVNVEEVKATIKDQFVLNRDVQLRQVQSVRLALAGEQVLGLSPTFAALLEKWPQGELVEKLQVTCSESAEAQHAAARLDDTKRIMGVSILSRLRRDYSGRREEFSRFLGDIVASAAPFLRFDEAEVQKKGEDLGLDPAAPRDPQQAIIVHRPVGADLGVFVADVDTLMAANFRGNPPRIVARSDKENEITVVTVVNNIPARNVELVQLLRRAYQALINDPQQSARARLEMHTADECADLPDLYAIDEPPRDGLTYVVLAEVLGDIRHVRSTVTGKNQVMLRVQTDIGLDEDIVLGADSTQAAAGLGARTTLLLQNALDRRLRALLHEDRKNEVKEALKHRLKQVETEVGGDTAAPRYVTEFRATARAIEIISTGRR